MKENENSDYSKAQRNGYQVQKEYIDQKKKKKTYKLLRYQGKYWKRKIEVERMSIKIE